MIGWHKTFSGKSKLMNICVQIDRLSNEWVTALGSGKFSDANKDPRSFEDFYSRVDQMVKLIHHFSNTLLQANSAIHQQLQNYEEDIERESVLLSAEEKTDHHILNQLKVLRNLSHQIQERKEFDEEKLGQIYEGIVRLDNFFKTNVKVLEDHYKIIEKEMARADEMITSLKED